MFKLILFLTLLTLLVSFLSFGQGKYSSAEDSLNNSIHVSPSTSIGGYGDAVYQRNTLTKTSTVDLERIVLFVGHNFSSGISFFSELEMEDAKVSGGEDGGEIAFEQAYLKFNLDHDHYLSVGLFLPRIGILNENHLPTSFNGNERTQVETYILPSTWRELGIGFYGSLNTLPMNYSIAIVNGLNSGSFQHGSGIREGRYEGRNANANNLAITGALQLNQNDIKFQMSGYYGGTVALDPQQADSSKLNAGMFGTPISIGEADVQYEAEGLKCRILGTLVSIPNAEDINRVYANNTPNTEYGAYAEVGYNLFEHSESLREKQLIAFVRYEKLDMNATTASNGFIDGVLNQQHIITGLSYLPIDNIVIKADVRFMHTAEVSQQNTTFFNLGFGFSY